MEPCPAGGERSQVGTDRRSDHCRERERVPLEGTLWGGCVANGSWSKPAKVMGIQSAIFREWVETSSAKGSPSMLTIVSPPPVKQQALTAQGSSTTEKGSSFALWFRCSRTTRAIVKPRAFIIRRAALVTTTASSDVQGVAAREKLRADHSHWSVSGG